MSWQRERDALIARTMAFVESVALKKEQPGPQVRPDAGRRHVETEVAAPFREIAPPPMTPLLRLAESPAGGLPSRAPLSRPKISSDFQREIQERIESFRKHQERFNRERAEYFNATLARLRAAIAETGSPRLGK
jgi:hypothetical protein